MVQMFFVHFWKIYRLPSAAVRALKTHFTFRCRAGISDYNCIYHVVPYLVQQNAERETAAFCEESAFSRRRSRSGPAEAPTNLPTRIRVAPSKHGNSHTTESIRQTHISICLIDETEQSAINGTIRISSERSRIYDITFILLWVRGASLINLVTPLFI